MTYSPFMSIMKQWQTKYFAHWNILSASISMIFAMVLGSVTLPVQRTLPADDVWALYSLMGNAMLWMWLNRSQHRIIKYFLHFFPHTTSTGE